MQQTILDRRVVLRILESVGIPTPRRLIAQRGDVPQLSNEVIERVKKELELDLSPETFAPVEMIQVDADTIRVGDETMKKPFVEKPVSGEDHNINIYYPPSMGGGARRLFRKVGNKSSEFDPEMTVVRMDGSYIYEEFMNVDNAEDVKVYTIGDYAHAETRKSPVVDGIVRRNAEGKEVRYVTTLSPEEKEIARKVGKAFGQTVCGFDLLRANGKSYVIDVNGWSFVKGNDDYYDKCARILSKICIEQARKRSESLLLEGGSDVKHGDESIETQWKLKAFLSVLRHGDRTPKQKMKFSFRSKPFLDLLNGGDEEVVLKKPHQLQRVVEAVKKAVADKCEDSAALDQLTMILDAKSQMAGTKVQIKPSFNKADKTTLEKVQLVVKWGGEFTHGGRHQSKDLGENLRKDLHIINKSLLEDVKIYTSSERRVTATSEMFAQAFLNMAAADIPPDFLIVNKEMLDDSNAAKEQMEIVKAKLQILLNFPPPQFSPTVATMPNGVTNGITTSGPTTRSSSTTTPPSTTPFLPQLNASTQNLSNSQAGLPSSPKRTTSNSTPPPGATSSSSSSSATSVPQPPPLAKISTSASSSGVMGMSPLSPLTPLSSSTPPQMSLLSSSLASSTTSSTSSLTTATPLTTTAATATVASSATTNGTTTSNGKTINTAAANSVSPPSIPSPGAATAYSRFNVSTDLLNSSMNGGSGGGTSTPGPHSHSSGNANTAGSTSKLGWHWQYPTRVTIPNNQNHPAYLVEEIAGVMRDMRDIMRENYRKLDVTTVQNRWCCAENPGLFKERWEKLFKDFCDVEKGQFDISKVSELYDSLKYDLLHNRKFIESIFASPKYGRELLRSLYLKAKLLFDFIAPQEYGLEVREKLEIGMLSAYHLLNQVVTDLEKARSSPKPCTRLYFTKESKVICLLNMVLLCGLPTKMIDTDELDYLTQITFELYERNRGGVGGNNSSIGLSQDQLSPTEDTREFSLRVGFSPGAHDPNLIDLHLDSKHSLSVAPRRWISDHISLDDALSYLTPKVGIGPRASPKLPHTTTGTPVTAGTPPARNG
ncbi:hypothetical protein HK102_006746, partial [Quaeritorhiza haematococci]